MTDLLKIAAVVVTYNRKELLKECLDALLAQTRPVDSIILMDNASTDGTPEFLEKMGYLSNPVIDYVRLPENTGGAGGFHYGIKRGYEKGFDWLWLMDDDAEPMEDSLELLLIGGQAINDENIGALASVVIDNNGNICNTCRGNFGFNRWNLIQTPLPPESYKMNNKIKIEFASFVGILISRNVIQRIGFPDAKFFIYHDDVEYCYRINQVSSLYLINKSFILHKITKNKDYDIKNILYFNFKRTSLKKFILQNIGIRNVIYLNIKYKRNINILKIMFSLLKRSAGVILFDKNKIKRTLIIWKAFFDGIRGRFDNSIIFKN